MKDDTKLPRELVWDGAHVSELGLTVLADGQESLLDRDAVTHATACDWCAGRMARAALLSAAVGGAVVATQPVRDASAARETGARPWIALSLGMLVAVLAAVPSLPHLGETLGAWLATGRVFTTHGIPVLARGGVALASHPSVTRLLPMVSVAASALLVMMGWAIARTRAPMSVERSMS